MLRSVSRRDVDPHCPSFKIKLPARFDKLMWRNRISSDILARPNSHPMTNGSPPWARSSKRNCPNQNAKLAPTKHSVRSAVQNYAQNLPAYRNHVEGDHRSERNNRQSQYWSRWWVRDRRVAGQVTGFPSTVFAFVSTARTTIDHSTIVHLTPFIPANNKDAVDALAIVARPAFGRLESVGNRFAFADSAPAAKRHVSTKCAGDLERPSADSQSKTRSR